MDFKGVMEMFQITVTWLYSVIFKRNIFQETVSIYFLYRLVAKLNVHTRKTERENKWTLTEKVTSKKIVWPDAHLQKKQLWQHWLSNMYTQEERSAIFKSNYDHADS